MDAVCDEIPASEKLSRELISTIVEHVASGWERHSTDDSMDDSDEDEEYGEQPHRNNDCDGCGMFPIVGIRYHSTARRNYDLCEACHAKLPEEEKRDDYFAIQPTVLPTREENRIARAQLLEEVARRCPNASKAKALGTTRRDLKSAALIGRAWRNEAMPLLAANKEAFRQAKLAAYKELAIFQQQKAAESMMARMRVHHRSDTEGK